jgi:4'-phosphopantetheinyl transferase
MSSLTALNHQPSDLVSSSGEIHVWWAFLEQPSSRLERLAEILSGDERTRVARYHFDKDKNRFIASRGILRIILGGYLGVRPDQLRFGYGDQKKPSLLDGSGKRKIHFNLSHSGGLVLYAFTRGLEIGVDIEKIRELADMEQIAERFFSDREKAEFSALPPDIKKAAFFNCWTRKEAFLKALGTGLCHCSGGFEVSLVPGEPAQLLRIDGDVQEASRWSIYEPKTASDFVAAIALRSHGYKRFRPSSKPGSAS